MPNTTRAVPVARFDHLVTTETGSDLLVYDQQTHHIHHLNATTAVVWHACDGQRTVDGIALATGLSHETVQLALIQLADAELLDGPLDPAVLPAGQSRRRFLKKAGLAGIAAPALVSVTAPRASAATSFDASCCYKSCSDFGGECFAGCYCDTCRYGSLDFYSPPTWFCG